MATSTRYRFGDLTLSPRQRLLLRDGRPIPLIPRYFDLLHLLIVRRRDAVSKQTIFTEVWSDVVVSDGALAQAVRTLRRTLGDDVREPRYIRTVSRHGYQFVWAEVVEELDDDAAAAADSQPDSRAQTAIEPLVEQLLTSRDPEAARDAAEQLHSLGTSDALSRVTAHPHHAPAVAILRDARWDVPDAGKVPLLRDSEGLAAIAALIRLRLAAARTMLARRWTSAAGWGALGGIVAGLIGGAALLLAPTSHAHAQSLIALGAIGALAGLAGAGGIGAGLAIAEALARSQRRLALVVCGAAAGAITGGLGSFVLRSLVSGLFGLTLQGRAGALDGMLLGAAAGLGYGLSTPMAPGGGLATPRGSRRAATAATLGICCGAAAIFLAATGHTLVGGLVHEIARSSSNADLVLAPLGQLVGDPGFGRPTQILLSAFEGVMFGASLGWGLTVRPAAHARS